MTKRIVLVIKCATNDVPIDFRVLAKRIGEDHEETLKRLLKLEQDHPLQKKVQGKIWRL